MKHLGRALSLVLASGVLGVMPTGAHADAPCAPVLIDPTGDQQHGIIDPSLGSEPPTATVDLSEIYFSSDDEALTVEVHVAPLLTPPAYPGTLQLTIQWYQESSPRSIGVAWQRDEPPSATGWNGFSAVWVDRTAGIIRVDVPRTGSDLADGAWLENIHVTAAVGTVTILADSRDEVPAYNSQGGRFLLGTACTLPDTHRCPLVTDPEDDVTHLVRAPQLRNYEPGLDLLAVGATSDVEGLTFMAHVVDPEVMPFGYDSMGWTISWVSGGTHWYALAERRADAVAAFAWGADPYNSWGQPVGASYGGHVAAGSIEHGIVSITVPRADLGNPADGALVRAVAATSWARPIAVPGLSSAFGDVTEGGLWRAGDSCPAA